MFTQYKPQFITSLILLGTLTFTMPVSAQETLVSADAAQKINSANELVRNGEFDKAIESYQQVTPNNANRDELNYNQAVAQFRKGDIQSAQAMFTEAATSNDTSIAANSRYNLGNCVYSTAIKTAEQDKPAAIEQLREAISHYRDSLRLSSDNADARANIELAADLIRKLQEEQKQEEQQKQDQQKQDQDQQKQDQDQQKNSNDQQSQDQQNQSEESKSDQQNSDQKSGSQQSESEQSKDEQDQSQRDQSKGNESDAEKSAQNDQQKDSQQNQSKDGQSKDEQSQQDKGDQQSQQQESAIEPSDSQDQKSQQEQPADQQPQSNANNQSQQNRRESQADQQSTGELQADEQVGEEENGNNSVPAGQLSAAGKQDENGNPTGTVAMVDPNAKDGLMTKEEAMKMLQAVRDRDMLRRLRQEQLDRSRHVPVDKDW